MGQGNATFMVGARHGLGSTRASASRHRELIALYVVNQLEGERNRCDETLGSGARTPATKSNRVHWCTVRIILTRRLTRKAGMSHEIIVNMFAYVDDNHDRDN